MSSALDGIVQVKRREIAALYARRHALEQEAAAQAAPRPFLEAIQTAISQSSFAIIGEFKRRSPSAGLIQDQRSVDAVARLYQAGGACTLSVLTDSRFFGGSAEDLRIARAAISLPVLRKDFVLDPVQLLEARAIGADAVLLIMSILSDKEARALCAMATELGMAVLLETHDEHELERALSLPSPLIGINNRNLHDMTTDLGTGERLCPLVPPERIAISESGIASASDLSRLRRAGARGFLIGQSLMSAQDPLARLKQLQGA